MVTEFKTIADISEGVYKDKGSKFLAFAFPVNNELEINMHRNELKKKYHDARHHVYAFYIGAENPSFRASDDGEPANSSGPPVLGQIRSFGLTNILIVVVRYFGGTKLGVPGLINAYKTAAFEALSNAKIITKKVEIFISIEFQYSDINIIMQLLKNKGIQIISQYFESICSIKLSVDIQKSDWLIESLSKIKSLKILKEQSG
jgi:uncharacterized YigZ family protein